MIEEIGDLNEEALLEVLIAIDEEKAMTGLKAVGWFRITGRGWVATVNTPHPHAAPCRVGDSVRIDGHDYECVALERFIKPMYPTIPGTMYGIIIRGEKQ